MIVLYTEDSHSVEPLLEIRRGTPLDLLINIHPPAFYMHPSLKLIMWSKNALDADVMVSWFFSQFLLKRFYEGSFVGKISTAKGN